MKLLFFIYIIIFSITFVNSFSNHGQLVINNKSNNVLNREKHVQKKRISNGHDNNDLDANSTVEWYSCSSDDSVLIIDEIRLLPDPAKRGKTVKVELEGFLLRDIEVGSRFKITVKYGSVTIYKDDIDLCEMIECPMKRGEIYASYEAKVYSYIPRGTYKADAYATEPDQQEIACVYGKCQIF
jgi:hypothetical protein